MFTRAHDQITREAASLKGLNGLVWCSKVDGAGSLADGQASAIIVSSKRFAHHQGLAFGLGASKPIRLANRLGNPEDRP